MALLPAEQDWECHCSCHKPAGAVKVVHMMPCCSTCRRCGAHVRRGMEDVHQKKCIALPPRVLQSIGRASTMPMPMPNLEDEPPDTERDPK